LTGFLQGVFSPNKISGVVRLRHKISARAVATGANEIIINYIHRIKRQVNGITFGKKTRRGPPASVSGAGVWRHAWGNGAQCPCTASLAVERSTKKVSLDF
jgi:hypothetical protein